MRRVIQLTSEDVERYSELPIVDDFEQGQSPRQFLCLFYQMKTEI